MITSFNNIWFFTLAILSTFSNNIGNLVQASQCKEVSTMPHNPLMALRQSKPLFLAVLFPQLQSQAPLERLLAALKTW